MCRGCGARRPGCGMRGRTPTGPATSMALSVILLGSRRRSVTPSGRRPPAGRIPYAPPAERMSIPSQHVRRIATLAPECRAGAAVRGGAERRSWWGTPGQSQLTMSVRDAALVARFSGGGAHRAAACREALATFDHLPMRGAFGGPRMTRAAYLRAHRAAIASRPPHCSSTRRRAGRKRRNSSVIGCASLSARSWPPRRTSSMTSLPDWSHRAGKINWPLG